MFLLLLCVSVIVDGFTSFSPNNMFHRTLSWRVPAQRRYLKKRFAKVGPSLNV
jgi:hypothetical protein